MRKVMRYECKRLLWNRFFVGLVLVLLFYGWQVLGGTTILGVAHTAPLSPWSFGDYLSRMTPLLWVGVLFFLTFFTYSFKSFHLKRLLIILNWFNIFTDNIQSLIIAFRIESYSFKHLVGFFFIPCTFQCS